MYTKYSEKCGGCAFFSAETKGIDRVWKGPCIMRGLKVTERTAQCASWVRKGSSSTVLSEAWRKRFGDK